MIDLNVIEAKCKSSIANGYGRLPVIDCGNAVKVMKLITRLRQAEKDAERYRWLRDEAQGQDLHVITSLGSLEWDSFIDGAMQCEQ